MYLHDNALNVEKQLWNMKINNSKFKGILTDMLSVRRTCLTVTYK